MMVIIAKPMIVVIVKGAALAEGVKRRMIEQAALSLASKGLQRTSFTEVLEASGAPRGSLYHHFPGGKDELILAALDPTGEWAINRMGVLAGLQCCRDSAVFSQSPGAACCCALSGLRRRLRGRRRHGCGRGAGPRGAHDGRSSANGACISRPCCNREELLRRGRTRWPRCSLLAARALSSSRGPKGRSSPSSKPRECSLNGSPRRQERSGEQDAGNGRVLCRLASSRRLFAFSPLHENGDGKGPRHIEPALS